MFNFLNFDIRRKYYVLGCCRNVSRVAAAEEEIATFLEDSQIYQVEVLFNSNGGNNHPDLDSHKAGAEKLIRFIQSTGVLCSEE